MEQKTSSLLIKEYPLLVLPELAKLIGLNEAIVLQQIHYWLNISKHEYDNKRWIYNSYLDWQKQFPFWSYATVKRTFVKLEQEDLLITGNYNKLHMDRTKWYSIDYQKLNTLAQQILMKSAKCADHQGVLPSALPETTPETTIVNASGKTTNTLRQDEGAENKETSGVIQSPDSSPISCVSSGKIGGSENFEDIKVKRNQCRDEANHISMVDICGRLGIVVEKPDSKGIVSAHCPQAEHHKNGDKHPSLRIFPDNRMFSQSCDFTKSKGHESIDNVELVQKVNNCSYEDAVEFILPGFKALRATKSRNWNNYLFEEKGYTQETIERYDLRLIKRPMFEKNERGEFKLDAKKRRIVTAYDPVIPIRYEGGDIHYRHILIEKGQGKYTWGSNRNNSLFKTKTLPNGALFLVEGEFDCISLEQFTGYAAWSGRRGAETFEDIWAKEIAETDCIVFICYDNDNAGVIGENLAAEKLLKYVPEDQISVIHLPDDVKDISEYFNKGYTREDFEKLLQNSTPLAQAQQNSQVIKLEFASASVNMG